jgi:predicted metal-dependent phosphoesterase TrpH
MYDFHMHTVFSDGACQPEALIEAAAKVGMKAMAITDHDTTLSFPVAQAAAEAKGIELIPGIEINTVWKDREVHVLGFFIDPTHEALQALIERHRKARIRQIEGMVTLLNTQAKLSITFEDIASLARCDGSIGRPHVAQAILKKGGATSISDAFQKYLNPKSKTYLRRETATPHEAVEVIYDSGGIPVIAHPGEMPDFEALVQDLMNYGLRGIEAYHRSHSPALIEFHCSLAEKYGLIVTGGTDFHGISDGYAQTLSRLHMPAWVYDQLKAEHQRRLKATFRAY